MAAKVRYSGAYILPEFVQRSLHTRLWHRFILAPFVFLYSFATFDFEILMPPPGFWNPYATLFYATPWRSEIFMPPTFMPPPKNLMPPRLCHPQGWHKKRGGGVKKKTNASRGGQEIKNSLYFHLCGQREFLYKLKFAEVNPTQDGKNTTSGTRTHYL